MQQQYNKKPVSYTHLDVYKRQELRDEKNTLVETSEVKTNKDWLRKTYNKLEENKTYRLKFFADEYNEGHTDATYKRNYLLKEIDLSLIHIQMCIRDRSYNLQMITYLKDCLAKKEMKTY